MSYYNITYEGCNITNYIRMFPETKKYINFVNELQLPNEGFNVDKSVYNKHDLNTMLIFSFNGDVLLNIFIRNNYSINEAISKNILI